ncbi:MAG TPA: hypothetical protein VFZ16_01825 [Hyphomicrobiaceae bacterium]|nr:hypothetical protein [Hyphomicrobiaceae bacterium]
MTFILLWLLLCVAVAIFANRYNRSAFGWFVFAFVLSPLVGFAFVAALGPAPEVAIEREREPTPRTLPQMSRRVANEAALWS